MREDALSQIASEFKLWGVKFTSRDTNGNHVEVQWQATPDKEIRRYVIAKTSSDWRGPLNAISHIRRTFKADGLTLKQECAKVKPVLAKALSLPEPVERDVDQIRMLRAEVADLSELVLEMASMVSVMKDALAATPVSAPVVIPAPVVEVPPFLPPAPQPPPAPLPLFQVLQPPQQVLKPPPKKPSVRSIKTINFVGDAWSSTGALARDMGLPVKIAYMKLYYLMRKDIIELSGDRWRKKPKIKVKPVVIAMTKRKTTRANGRSKH
jgi:hypothetical protein